MRGPCGEEEILERPLRVFLNEDEKAKLNFDAETRRYQYWQDRGAGEKPSPVKKKLRHLLKLEKAAEAADITKVECERLLLNQRAIGNGEKPH